MKATVRGLAIAGISAAALVAAAGCAGSASGHLTADPMNAAARSASMAGQAHTTPPATPVQAAPSPAAPVSAPPAGALATATSQGYQGPHFSSPESAMAYLASAFNSGDAADLHAVTTPNSYLELTKMWSGPVNLQLQSCTADASRGDYYCYFGHDYPDSLHKTGEVVAKMLVAPAENPGWYLYAIVECG